MIRYQKNISVKKKISFLFKIYLQNDICVYIFTYETCLNQLNVLCIPIYLFVIHGYYYHVKMELQDVRKYQNSSKSESPCTSYTNLKQLAMVITIINVNNYIESLSFLFRVTVSPCKRIKHAYSLIIVSFLINLIFQPQNRCDNIYTDTNFFLSILREKFQLDTKRISQCSIRGSKNVGETIS